MEMLDENISFDLKQCTRCKISKTRDNVNFPPHKHTKDKLDSWCRICRRGYRKDIRKGRYKDMLPNQQLKELLLASKCCAICNISGVPLCVDHDHKQNVVRGVLCNRCNLGLGQFRDDPLLLEFAAMYLLGQTDSPEWLAYAGEVVNG